MVEVFEDESFTDSFHIIRYKSIRPDTTVVGSYEKRYYLSLIRKPGRFDESKVGTYTEGDYIIEEMTYKGQKDIPLIQAVACVTDGIGNVCGLPARHHYRRNG